MDKNYLDALDKYFATLENTGSIDQKTKNMFFMNMSLGKIGENVNLTEEQKEIVKKYFNCMKHNSCFSNSLKDSCCQTSRCSDSQVQADWTEENPYSYSYIQHKPEIPEHFQGKNVLANSSTSPENSVNPTDNDTTYLNHVENEEVTDGGSLKIQGDGGVSVNAENGTLTIFAKDVDVDLLIPITYNDLKTLRNNNGLKPGCRYRITDYVTKANIDLDEFDPADVYPEDLPYLSFSANHPFDIVVLATSTNKLSETARAIKHDGDTYFAKSNLEAWELKYNLDNDLRYEWIIDPFNEGEEIHPPFAFCYITTKADDQNPDYHNVVYDDYYYYDVNNICNDVPQWLYDQIDAYIALAQQHGETTSIEVGDTYYVPDQNSNYYGMAQIQSMFNGETKVVYFNRITILNITIDDGEFVTSLEMPVVYDYENPNVWHVEDGEETFDFGVSFGPSWGIMTKKTEGEWVSVEIPKPSKINLPVHDCKGVVFYMKDEFNNEANYDFKNIVYCYNYDSHPIKFSSKETYIIPNNMSSPTQVLENGKGVEFVYDDNIGYYVPYHNGEQCLVAFPDNQSEYYTVVRYVNIYNESYDNYIILYAGYSSLVGNTNFTTIFSYQKNPNEIEFKIPVNPSEYELGLYLGYTFSKGYEEFNDNVKSHEKKRLTGKETKEELKEILKNRTHTFKDYKSDKKKTITSSALKELSAKNIKKDEPKKRTLSERKSRILQLAEKYKKNSIENIFGFKQNTKTSDAKNDTKSDNDSAFWLTIDASLNDFDYELYAKFIPSVIGENKVHGYVVNYDKNYDYDNPDTSVFGCYTLPMALFLLSYYEYNRYNSAMTFNKIYLDGYDGVVAFDTLWFEGNILNFPYNKAYSNYIQAYSFGAMYNYGDYYTEYIVGSPDSMDDGYDKEWHQGDYKWLKNKPYIPDSPVQSDWDENDTDSLAYIKNKPDLSSLENGEFPGNWRTPTKDEWEYLLNTRSASTVNLVNNARYTKAQVNSVNGLILLPDVFTLPASINMVNINSPAAAFSDNIYTIAQWEILENIGCIFLPAGGYRNGTNVGSVGNGGIYWSSSLYNDEYCAYSISFDSPSVLTYGYDYYFGLSVRLIEDNNIHGLFSTSSNTKCNIAKSNLQFHCLNKEWRFAPNAYDVIGSDNANIAESYNGWIDLFGFGTSGWNSGAVVYQPWSISTDNADYINHDLTGAYANADWGVYDIKKQLHEVAFSGDYNDLSNKPVHELAALTDLDDLITNTALIKDHTYYITGGTDVYLAISNATCIKYSGSVYPVI